MTPRRRLEKQKARAAFERACFRTWRRYRDEARERELDRLSRLAGELS